MLDLDLLVSGVRLATPLLLAALAGVLCERSGVVALALEGKLLAGAFAAAAVAPLAPSPWLGVAAGAAAGALVGVLLSAWAVWLACDAIVVGIALNLFVLGATQFLLEILFGSSANSPTFAGFAARGPFAIPPLAFVAFALVPVVHAVLFSTRFGLRVRACGENPDAAASRGVDPRVVRTAAVLLAGALAGIGGAYLSLDAGQFVKNMSAGRGFLALAAVIFGKWSPGGAAAACLLFGIAEAMQIRLQGQGVPTQFVQMIPYVLTMVALAGFVGRSRAPAALGKRLARVGACGEGA